MKNIVILILIVIFIFADDIPAEFANFNEEFKSQETKNFHFHGKFKFRYYHFFKTTHYNKVSNRKDFIDLLLETNARYHKNNDTFNLATFFAGGNFSDSYKTKGVFLEEFRDLSRKIPIIGIKEAYYLHNFENVDFTIGKMIYLNSASTLYSPNDIYNLDLAIDPLNIYRVGSWLVKWDYYVNDARYSFVIFPFISYSKFVSLKTRWSGGDKDTTITFNGVSSSKIILDKHNKIRAIFGYRNTINKYDLVANLGVGSSPYTVLLKIDSDTYEEHYPRDIWVSIGASTTYKKLELHFESYYQVVENNEDDDFISSVVGGKYTFSKWLDKIGLKKVDAILEYAREFVVDKVDNQKVYKSSEDERAFKNDILLELVGEINYKFHINYFANFRLSTKGRNSSGRYQKIGFNYKIKDAMDLGVYTEFFNGEKYSYYGRWKDNDRIITEFKYSF
jgi:hypothetical protein